MHVLRDSLDYLYSTDPETCLLWKHYAPSIVRDLEEQGLITAGAPTAENDAWVCLRDMAKFKRHGPRTRRSVLGQQQSGPFPCM